MTDLSAPEGLKARETYRHNPARISPQTDFMVPSYDWCTKQVKENKNKHYFNVFLNRLLEIYKNNRQFDVFLNGGVLLHNSLFYRLISYKWEKLIRNTLKKCLFESSCENAIFAVALKQILVQCISYRACGHPRPPVEIDASKRGYDALEEKWSRSSLIQAIVLSSWEMKLLLL